LRASSKDFESTVDTKKGSNVRPEKSDAIQMNISSKKESCIFSSVFNLFGRTMTDVSKARNSKTALSPRKQRQEMGIN